MGKANEIYERVTARIVAELETANPKDWRAPWHSRGSGMPHNVTTGVAYRGGNAVALWGAELEYGYSSPVWATYKQWQSIGAQVRRGEKSEGLVKWVVKEDGPRDDNGRRRMFPVGFSVFNAAQVDGYELPTVAPGPDPIPACEDFVSRTGAEIVRGEPSYVPSLDVVRMPDLASFKDAQSFYAVACHELTHWTGHASRLARDLSGRFGSESYAAEELVAEMGAAFLAAQLGISTEPRPDHARYVKSWLKVLKSDVRNLYGAATLAQNAADYLARVGGLAESRTDELVAA